MTFNAGTPAKSFQSENNEKKNCIDENNSSVTDSRGEGNVVRERQEPEPEGRSMFRTLQNL